MPWIKVYQRIVDGPEETVWHFYLIEKMKQDNRVGSKRVVNNMWANKNKVERWIKAGSILANNSCEKVLCPECELDYLIVSDENPEGTPVTERIM